MTRSFTDSVRTRLATQLDSLTYILQDISADKLKNDPGGGKWSIHQILAHLVRHHQVMVERINCILATDNPLLDRYKAELDPEWPSTVARSTDEIVELLHSVRGELIRVVDRLSPSELSRSGTHSLMGTMDLRGWIDFFLLHEAHHLYGLRFLRVKSEPLNQSRNFPSQ